MRMSESATDERKGPAVNRLSLAYFEYWLDPVAERVLKEESAIEVVRLKYDAPLEVNAAIMRRIHGYQVHPRTELQPPWFVNASLLERCPNLLAVSSTGAGYDYIDVEACTSAGVAVCNQGGTNAEAVAEHALGFMIALSKRIVSADRALRSPEGVDDRFRLRGNDLRGKTLGIVGLGAIGSRLAQLCAGLLGMRVLAYDPYLLPGQAVERNASPVQLDVLLREADFVSVNCPRTSETLNMFGREQFALMRETAFFINTARGGIHDEDALAEALRRGVIAGAGVDVFLVEPPSSDHPLLHLDNVIATPHTAGVTAEAVHQMASAAAQQWVQVLSGQVPLRLVNPEVWPRYSQRFEQITGAAPEPLR